MNISLYQFFTFKRLSNYSLYILQSSEEHYWTTVITKKKKKKKTLKHPKASKSCIQGDSQENALSSIISKGASYGCEIDARAATPNWQATGGQCIVQEVPGLNPEGNLHFWHLPFRRVSIETKRGGGGLGS